MGRPRDEPYDDDDGTPLLVRLARIRWRLDALDEWRKEVDGRVSVVESKVNDLRFSDEVANALAKQLAASRRLELTIVQKVGAGLFALALVVVPTLLSKWLA